MREKIVHYFSKIALLSEDEASAIKNSAVVKNYAKGTVLVHEGQFSKETFFVLKGLIRQYNLTEGEEKTTAFFTEEQWVMALNNLEGDNPSPYYWVCEEDSVLLLGNDDSAQIIFNQFPRLESLARKIVENTFADYQQTILNYLTDSPEQRYLRLLESRPDLIQRIPQYQLASYIGVKPESLSRIRKRLTKKP
ncbi:Crp/Fnr family transcriptional regulator [Runella aurantiaca]|uniref:Crp/Fnr family transcriptional regulator n=1 Tax=Runella aurantiaca TaxID=2282308 RepID=A0A369IL41_9BACT|nr:Crp/Fnr family transcriptional regulator [Runella aurantiaca]RDB07366.1 Crp/Fnr family transcriptional regulator [Runella aurantiaca]